MNIKYYLCSLYVINWENKGHQLKTVMNISAAVVFYQFSVIFVYFPRTSFPLRPLVRTSFPLRPITSTTTDSSNTATRVLNLGA